MYNKLKPIMRNHSDANKLAIKQGKISTRFRKGCSPYNKGIHQPNKLNNIRQQVIDFYNKGHSLGETRLHFGGNVRQLLVDSGIYIRSNSESKKIQFEKGFANYYLKGETNGAWKDGKSLEPYTLEFTRQLKELIRKRDGYICQKCDIPECELGKKLEPHHIDYDKSNCLPNNLISLCHKCNTQVNWDREYWQNYFTEMLKERHPLQLYDNNN